MDRELSAGRLRWACRRGMLELDLLLGGFVDQDYHRLSTEERQTFQRLLDYPDQQLYEFCLGQDRPNDKDIEGVIEKIRQSVTAHT